MGAPDERQIECIRKMSPADRLRAAARLYWSARNLKRAGVRMVHPDWSEAEVEREVKRLFLYGTD